VDQTASGEGESEDKLRGCDEEQALFREYQQNPDPELQERIFARYSRLVMSIVRKFHGRAEWDDLIQVGYLGLLKAIQAYNPSSGNRFSTYATHCVVGELRHYLRDKTETVRRPRWLQSVSKKIAGFVEDYLQTRERFPSVAEISEACNISREGVVEVLKAGTTLSLEQLQGDEGRAPDLGRIRSLREESFVLKLEDRILLESALEQLVEVEKRVLRLFFYRDLNQSQIAGQTGLPPKRVSRLVRKALDKLRSILRLEGTEHDG